MHVTEFACMRVKPDIDVMKDDTPEGRMMTRAWEAATSQPGGHRAYWGLEVENPSSIWGFLDWDSVQDHEKWTKTPLHKEVTKDFDKILELDKTEFIKHVCFNPYPPAKVLDATTGTPLVTEVMLAYFPSDISSSGKQHAASKFQQFVDKALKTSPDFKGVSSGWGVETDFPIRGEKGKTGTIFAAFIAWPSLEAHMRFRETDAFKDNVHFVTDMDDLIKVTQLHVSCRSLASKE